MEWNALRHGLVAFNHRQVHPTVGRHRRAQRGYEGYLPRGRQASSSSSSTLHAEMEEVAKQGCGKSTVTLEEADPAADRVQHWSVQQAADPDDRGGVRTRMGKAASTTSLRPHADLFRYSPGFPEPRSAAVAAGLSAADGVVDDLASNNHQL